MNSELFIDTSFASRNYCGEKICGDSHLVRSYNNGLRTVVILSDGMGHGVKAHILSNYTATMLLQFFSSTRNMADTAHYISRMLPVCGVRKVSYSTFTIADINNLTGEVVIIQYDNPAAILLRDGVPVPLEWTVTGTRGGQGREILLKTTRFITGSQDRIILTTDGITQSGQKTGLYKFGWGEKLMGEFAAYLVSMNNGISAADLASQILSKSYQNDGGRPSDDMSCIVMHLRQLRQMMLISCPPSLTEYNKSLVRHVSLFEGEKIISGYPVAKILADGMQLPMERTAGNIDPMTVPLFRIPTFSMVTDGLTVPNRVLDLLERKETAGSDNSVAGKLLRTFLRNDKIEFVIGLKKNFDTDNLTPDEFEIRRNILSRIARRLEEDYGKKVIITKF